MGNLCSSPDPEKAASRELGSQMAKDHKADEQVNKLLLLGAGESGKSTFFKQLKVMYPPLGKKTPEGFSEKEVELYKTNIHTNIIANIQALLNACENGLGGSPKLPEKFGSQRDTILELKEGPLTKEHGEIIASLWQTEEIQKTYENRAKFQLVDNAAYFFERIDKVVEPDFKPVHDDIVMVRVRTTGIVEQVFSIDANEFLIVDVGGQRSERKKWIKCFSSVTAVLFCAAISAFDQTLFEDGAVNRMDEAIGLFKYVCEHKDFKKTAMIVFLNKSDLFRAKLQTVQLKSKYPDYNGDNSFESGCEYMKSLFAKVNEATPDRGLYMHVTCATDRGQVETLFFAVLDIIIRKNLVDSGLSLGS